MTEKTAEVIDSKALVAEIKDEIRTEVEKLDSAGWPCKLVSIGIGESAASQIYIRHQRRAAESVGIAFENRQFPADITQDEVLASLQSMNVDPRVTGIILQRPIPKHLDLDTLQFFIHPSKDVEGMNPANIGNIVYGKFRLVPCTALASVELLKRTGLPIRGMEVVMIGHSEIVGKPVSLLLMEDLATVTVTHHGTVDLASHTRRADAVFVAVGKPGLITKDMIKPGAVVIDIGINQVQVTDENGKTRNRVVGDVDYEEVKKVAGWITPVPGGVGPVTVAVLLRNAVYAAQNQRRKYEKAMKM